MMDLVTLQIVNAIAVLQATGRLELTEATEYLAEALRMWAEQDGREIRVTGRVVELLDV